MHSFTQFEQEGKRRRREVERGRGERPKQFVLLGPGHKVFVTLTLAGRRPDDLMGRMCHSWGRAGCVRGQYKLNRRRMVKKPSRIGSCFLQSSAKKTCARETDFFCKVFSSQLKGMSDWKWLKGNKKRKQKRERGKKLVGNVATLNEISHNYSCLLSMRLPCFIFPMQIAHLLVYLAGSLASSLLISFCVVLYARTWSGMKGEG